VVCGKHKARNAPIERAKNYDCNGILAKLISLRGRIHDTAWHSSEWSSSERHAATSFSFPIPISQEFRCPLE